MSEIDRIIRELDELMDYIFERSDELYDLEKHELKPLTQIIETDSEVIVTLDLPGISKEDISIKSTEDTLLIRANCSNKLRVRDLDAEFKCYSKNITLPAKVDPKEAKAYFKGGILQIRLPKKIEGKSIQVE